MDDIKLFLIIDLFMNCWPAARGLPVRFLGLHVVPVPVSSGFSPGTAGHAHKANWELGEPVGEWVWLSLWLTDDLFSQSIWMGGIMTWAHYFNHNESRWWFKLYLNLISAPQKTHLHWAGWRHGIINSRMALEPMPLQQEWPTFQSNCLCLDCAEYDIWI